jgi:hypothetical protein
MNRLSSRRSFIFKRRDRLIDPRAATIQKLAGIPAIVFSIAQDFPQHIPGVCIGWFIIGCFDLSEL